MYHYVASGYQPGGDAVLHVDLILRPKAGGADQVLASGDSPKMVPDGGVMSPLDVTWNLPAVPAVCGDLLAAKVTMVSGAQPFIEFGTHLDIP
jgi:hypothetical protein